MYRGTQQKQQQKNLVILIVVSKMFSGNNLLLNKNVQKYLTFHKEKKKGLKQTSLI